MDIDRNAPCPCDSGKKLKRCCLDEHVAWERDGKGIMDTYVKLPDGSQMPDRGVGGNDRCQDTLGFRAQPDHISVGS